MRLLTAISIVTLATSTGALALVLWLVITQPWIVEEPPASVVATPTFTEDEVLVAVKAHMRRNGKPGCLYMSNSPAENWEISQDPSNPEKYIVESSNSKWTFYMGNVTTVGGYDNPAVLLGC